MGKADPQQLYGRAVKKKLHTMDHHVLVCVDSDCDGGKITKHLKKRVAAAGLRTSVTTTKVKCLNICKGGTVVVVYPEGTWYGGVTEDVADRIVDEHLAEGRPVEAHAFLRQPMSAMSGLCAITNELTA